MVDVSKSCVVPIPKPLLLLSHIKFDVCNSGLVPFPINICPAVKDVEPVPPKETGKVPAVTFDAFNAFFNG